MTPTIFKSYFPEIFFSFFILFQLVFNSYLISNRRYNYPILSKEMYSQTLFVLVALIVLLWNLNIECIFNNFLFVNDEGGRLAKLYFLFICLGSLPIIYKSFILQNLNFPEFFSLLLLAILSLMLLINSHDFLSFYLSLEMQSLAFYVLASFKRNSSFSTDAGLKYFISGSFISGIFLFGCSLLYGVLGTLNLDSIQSLLCFSVLDEEIRVLLTISVVLITSILLFKIACAPFHFWLPDVYDGAPLSSTIVFSLIPKVPLFFFFVKWISVLGVILPDISPVLQTCGVFSVLLGTFFAIFQKRLKRLIIYSSIAQIGFLVCGISLGCESSFVSVYFFLGVYMITSILIWGHFVVFYNSQREVNAFLDKETTSLFLTNFSKLSNFNAVFAASFLVIFFSIAGIPPLTGFLSKILIVNELVSSGYSYVGTSLVVISSISVFYYIRIIKLMYFEPIVKISFKSEISRSVYKDNFLDLIYLVFSTLLFVILALFFYPTTFYLICEYVLLTSTGI